MVTWKFLLGLWCESSSGNRYQYHNVFLTLFNNLDRKLVSDMSMSSHEFYLQSMHVKLERFHVQGIRCHVLLTHVQILSLYTHGMRFHIIRHRHVHLGDPIFVQCFCCDLWFCIVWTWTQVNTKWDTFSIMVSRYQNTRWSNSKTNFI